jgi:hypothetical protein
VRPRHRDLRERLQLDPEPRTARRQLVEQRELQLVGVDNRDLCGLRLVARRREPIHGQEEARLVALQFDRRVARIHDGVVGLEPIEHPADGRRAIGCTPRVDGTGHDEPVDRPRHSDVIEAKPLVPLLPGRGVLDIVPGENALASPARRVHHPKTEASVGERDDLVRAVRAAGVAPRVRDDHDLELETFRSVNREEANRSAPLLLGDCLELLRPQRVLLPHETHEPLDVGAPDSLVVAGEPSELAHVGEAACAVPARQDGEVVVVLGDDSLAQLLEPDAVRRAHETLVALEKRTQQALVALGKMLREPALERREERTAWRVAARENERVVRDADERRGEHRRQGDVVVAVVEEPEVGEQVDDLLLPEVATTGRAVRGQSLSPEGLLVSLRVRSGSEEHDDLAGLGLTGVNELPDARRNLPSFTRAPVDIRTGEGRLVRHEKLDGMSEHGVREFSRCGEGLVVLSERVAEQVVDGRQDLRA